MEVLGFIFGATAMVIATRALTKISALEKKLKGTGVLEKESKSDYGTGSSELV